MFIPLLIHSFIHSFIWFSIRPSVWFWILYVCLIVIDAISTFIGVSSVCPHVIYDIWFSLWRRANARNVRLYFASYLDLYLYCLQHTTFICHYIWLVNICLLVKYHYKPANWMILDVKPVELWTLISSKALHIGQLMRDSKTPKQTPILLYTQSSQCCKSDYVYDKRHVDLR